MVQCFRERSGWLDRQLAPARFDAAAFEQQLCCKPEELAGLWAKRAAYLPAAPDHGCLRQFCDSPLWQEHVVDVCTKAMDGDYPFFSGWQGQIGWPPDFNLDPVNGTHWPVGQEWLNAARPKTDLKMVWEASRFTLAYYLARAYAADGDDRWAQAFWKMVEAHVAQCPPHLSAAWVCDQEASFRLMAMLTAAATMLNAPATTPARLCMLTKLAWQIASATQINLNQSRMQGNNHSMSESAVLWTCGCLFPEFRQSASWRRQGMAVLMHEAGRLIYDDGSFVQHSTNYHRVMLDDLLWVAAVAARTGETLPPELLKRAGLATQWLGQMVDPVSGMVPNYGNNDGANVLPLSCTDYVDYRPALQAAGHFFLGRRVLGPGPWDEKLLWLAPQVAWADSATPLGLAPATSLSEGGYYFLRQGPSWCMMRCHSYRHRPAQADMLHLDLWVGGLNLLRDSGTFMYNCPQPWLGWFYSTAAHNTVEVDARDQMVKGPRFLWFGWTKSRLLEHAASVDCGVLSAEHYGYLPRGVVHRRTVRQEGQSYTITDELSGTGDHSLALRWHLLPAQWTPGPDGFEALADGWRFSVKVSAPQGATQQIVVGQSDPVEGWESRYYGRKEPCPTLVIKADTSLPARFVTTVQFIRAAGPSPARTSE